MSWNLPLSSLWLWLLLCLLPAAMAAEPEVKPELKSEEIEYDLLFLDAFLDKSPLANPLEIVTADFEHFYLPLEDLTEQLELALVVDPETYHVGGWFITENNPVTLNFTTNKYRIGDKSGVINPGEWLIEDDMLYLRDDALLNWFGLTSEIKTNTLKVNFTSEQPLPAQAKLARQQMRKLFDMRQGKTLNANAIDDRYQWFTLPLLDMNSQLDWQDKQGEITTSNRYSINGSGDIGQHASEFSYNKNASDQQLRLKLHKQINVNQRDWYYEFGDINGIGNELSGGGGMGRGFAFRNSRNGNQRFNSHRFEGNAQPGWEAELYRNGSLIKYLEVGDEGYYLFDEIPVLLGKNDFKIVLYGPQGKQKIIEESFTGHQLDQAAGQWTPSFSFNQPKQRLLPLGFEQQHNFNLNSQLSYGISDKLQASVGWNRIQGDSSAHQYLNSALTGVWQNTVFNLAASLEPDSNQLSYKADFQAEIWQHNWNVSFQQFDDLQGKTGKGVDFSMQGSQSLLSEQDSYSLSLNHFNGAEGQSLGFNAQHSANFDGLSLNNRWEVQKTDQGGDASGNIGISSRFGAHQLRLESQYRLWPERQIETVSSSYSRRFKSTFLQLRSNIREDSQRSDISAQLSWSFNNFRLGTRVQIDKQHNVSASLTFSMGLGVLPKGFHYSRDTIKRTATIKAMAFMDNNNNGIFDQDETPLSGISFKGNDQWRNRKTDETGVVYLPGARTTNGQYLEFESDSLDDPFLAVDQTRFNVQTHAGGLNELYFPVYQTTEIEGELLLIKTAEDDGKAHPAVPLLLLDRLGNTVKRILTEYDGFFIFDAVKPGEYRIVVEDKYLKRKGYRFDQAIEVDASVIDQDSDTIEVGTLLIRDIEVNTQ